MPSCGGRESPRRGAWPGGSRANTMHGPPRWRCCCARWPKTRRAIARAAVAALREGIDRAEATDTILYAQPARYRLGELLGGDEGAALIRQAVEAMTAEGVRNPKRWVNCHMPGDWKPS